MSASCDYRSESASVRAAKHLLNLDFQGNMHILVVVPLAPFIIALELALLFASFNCFFSISSASFMVISPAPLFVVFFPAVKSIAHQSDTIPHLCAIGEK